MAFHNRKRLVPILLAGTMLAGISTSVFGQTAGDVGSNPVATPSGDTIRSITVNGSQRLEADTVRSYMKLRVGQTYSQEAADQALKDLFETELFKDVSIQNNAGAVIIDVVENPVINRILLEGNSRIKDDKIFPEIRLAPRQLFTRSKVRADVARIIELYKRKGRFAASVEPKSVQLDQNRVDIVFEIDEGPRSKVRQINIIGNEEFSDGKLRGQMATKQSRFFRFFTSNDTYDPDRLAFDQQKLRQFYLTEGYADFRVVSAVAELTPDKRDFIITYVVEEGQRYKFGEVEVESEIRDFTPEQITPLIPVKKGEFYNAKTVEDTVESLSETAGLFGYAFADIRPQFRRDKENLEMNVTFRVAETPRVYVERIDINGNTLTQDKVIRREFRLSEGDAFNSFRVRRSSNRIKSLGYFQENLEIEQKPGSESDRIILEANVEENATGELSLSAGFSSVENFILQASVRQRNFRGKGQQLRASVSFSSFSQSIELGFTEPYLFGSNIALGGDIFRRDLNNRNLTNNNTSFEQLTTGFQLRAGVPITEFLSASLRYSLNIDDVTIGDAFFLTDPVTGDFLLNGSGDRICNDLLAGFFLCDAIGERTTSLIGASLIYDTRNNRARPSRGHQIVGNLDFAGLGGSVKYLRARVNASKHWRPFGNFIFSVSAEGGYIKSLENRGSPADGIDDVRLTDRFFLGEPQLRGFDIRGVGPRVLRQFNAAGGFVAAGQLLPNISPTGGFVNFDDLNENSISDDAVGGRAFYRARAELEIPLGSGIAELGLRPSLFVDAGAVFNVTNPIVGARDQAQIQVPNPAFDPDDPAAAPQFLDPVGAFITSNADGLAIATDQPFAADGVTPNAPLPILTEQFFGDSPSPRVSVGFGVNWNSPFGPFRIDIARSLLSQPGDDTKLITFNVGTQF